MYCIHAEPKIMRIGSFWRKYPFLWSKEDFSQTVPSNTIYRVTHNFLTPSVFWRYKELRSYWFSTQVESHCGYSICRLLWDKLKISKHCQCWILRTSKVNGCMKIMGHPVYEFEFLWLLLGNANLSKEII